MQNLNKLKTFRLDSTSLEMLSKISKYRIQSKFVREAIKEKFEKDYPAFIELEKIKQEKQYCPF